MASANDAFDALLRKRIDEELREMGDHALVGIATSLEHVNYRNGMAAGLKKCIGLCEEVQTEISKR